MTYASTHGIAPSSKEQASYLEPALIASGMIGIRRGEKMKVETRIRLYRKLMAVNMAADSLGLKVAVATVAFLIGLICLFLRHDLIGGLFVAGAILLFCGSVLFPLIFKQPLRITPEYIEQEVAKERAKEKAKG